MSKTRNYVGAWVDYDTEQIVVVERDENGKSFRTRHNCPYYFYVPAGENEVATCESIYGDKLVRKEYDNRRDFEKAKLSYSKKFESDFSPLKRVMMDKYYGIPAPKVHYAFLDIETDYKKKSLDLSTKIKVRKK